MGRRSDERETERCEEPASSDVQADWLAICTAVRCGLLWQAQQMASMDAPAIALLVSAMDTAMDSEAKALTFSDSVEARRAEIVREGYGG